jgi:hypothetical protein
VVVISFEFEAEEELFSKKEFLSIAREINSS